MKFVNLCEKARLEANVQRLANSRMLQLRYIVAGR